MTDATELSQPVATDPAARGAHALSGEVEARDGASAVVSTPEGLLRARIALSCLIRPEPGDRVLVERCATEAYVTAVLERTADAPLLVETPRSLAVAAGGVLTLGARTVAVRGEAIEIAGASVSVVSRSLQWVADTLESTARLVSQVAERWSMRARTHDRRIEDLELVRVGHLDVEARELVNLHARHTVMKSEELTKIDAKQIQVG